MRIGLILIILGVFLARASIEDKIDSFFTPLGITPDTRLVIGLIIAGIGLYRIKKNGGNLAIFK